MFKNKNTMPYYNLETDFNKENSLFDFIKN